MNNYINIILFTLILFKANFAFAYLDPGTTTFIIQSIIAGIAGFFVTIGIYWTKLISFIKNIFLKKNKKK